MKRNPVVDAVLTPDMYRWLRDSIKPTSYSQEIECKPNKIVRPSPSSYRFIVINATVASETPKAYNFKVLLDASKYPLKLPFAPSVYIWMPKYCSRKLDSSYWEVDQTMAMENLNKALVNLKKTLINKYDYEAHEIILLKGVHLL